MCNCTLAGTRACLNCPNYQQYFGLPQFEPMKTFFPKKKKVTEKYDKDGSLIERIIEE